MRYRRLAMFAAMGTIVGACNGSGSTTTEGSSSGGPGGTTEVAPTSGVTEAATTAEPTGAGSSTSSGSATSEPATTTGGMAVTLRVFITAATFHGDLKAQGAGSDGVDGADRLCAAAAAAAGLGGSWVAWVSSSSVDALSRLAVDGRWVLPDGTTEVFPSRAAIQFGPEHAIDVAETGATLPAGETIWTNTDSFGKNSTDGQNDACDDWSGQTGLAAVGVLFDPDFGGAGLSWTDTKQPQACGGVHHLYCFEA